MVIFFWGPTLWSWINKESLNYAKFPFYSNLTAPKETRKTKLSLLIIWYAFLASVSLADELKFWWTLQNWLIHSRKRSYSYRALFTAGPNSARDKKVWFAPGARYKLPERCENPPWRDPGLVAFATEIQLWRSEKKGFYLFLLIRTTRVERSCKIGAIFTLRVGHSGERMSYFGTQCSLR